MTVGVLCFIVAAVLLILHGLHIIDPSAKFEPDHVAAGFIVLGFALGGVAMPSLFVGRKE